MFNFPLFVWFVIRVVLNGGYVGYPVDGHGFAPIGVKLLSQENYVL